VQSKRPPLRVGLRLTTAGLLLVILATLLCIGPSSEKLETIADVVETTIPTLTAIPPSQTPEPLVPTRTPTSTPEPTRPTSRIITPPTSPHTDPPLSPIRTQPPSVIETPTVITATTPTLTSTPTSAPTLVPSSSAALWQDRFRWGVGVARGSIADYDVEPLRLGWYLNWGTSANPARPGGVAYAQMVRLKDGVLNPAPETIVAIAQANPGSLWLISNEPDVKWQDNVEAATYARLYNEAYAAAKSADPTAQVAIGGISQPTPLRLRYLDAILVAYQDQFGAAVPMDAWHVHNFILREERGSWGVDIPPGFSDDAGMLYEIDDNDDIDIFRQQIVSLRQWMLDHGYGDYPLIVSEYGIPMPEDYGFPPERVVAYLEGTFGFFLTATDGELGYPQDGNRLVQLWCWYSLNAPDSYYPQGRLIDPQTGELTPIGIGWKNLVNQ
jgi:hypothetical protein